MTFDLDKFSQLRKERALGTYGIHVDISGKQFKKSYRSEILVLDHLYSASKTYTALAIGIAKAEGLLNLNDPIAKFFPEFGDMVVDTSTIRDTLQMVSGKKASFPRTNRLNRAFEYLKSQPVCAPREKFIYNDMSSYILSCIVEKVSGATLRNYLIPRLFTPMGIDNPQWDVSPQGQNSGGWGLHLTLDDFAKLGQLLLHYGEWGGRQLVSSDFVKAMVTDLVDTKDFCTPLGPSVDYNNGYGYHIWCCRTENTIRADGIYGQFCIVFYDIDIVVTILSHCETFLDILDSVYECLQ